MASVGLAAGGPSFSARPQRLAIFAYWLGTASIILFLAFNLVALAFRGTDFSFVSLGIAVASQCAILWIGHVTKIRAIGRPVAIGIWTTLILSLLGTAAAVVSKTTLSPQHIKIEKFLLLDSSDIEIVKNAKGQDYGQLTEFKTRPNSDYKLETYPNGQNDVVIAFACVVSGFQRDDHGNFIVDGEVTLASGEIRDFGRLPKLTDKNYLGQLKAIERLNMKDIEKILGSPGKDKVWYIHVLRRFNKPVLDPGAKTLRVVVRDGNNYTSSQAEQEIMLVR